MLSLLLYLTVLFHSVPTALATRHYDIINNCPLGINLYINGVSQGSLTSYGGQTSRDFPDNWSGLIYTDFNRGNWDGAGTVRAGFRGDLNYYYVVTDPNWFNAGISIQPINRAPVGGMCFPVTCEYEDCGPTYVSQPPSSLPPFTGGIPPTAPLYVCPQAETGYKVTFCPSGEIHNYNLRGIPIQPSSSLDKCVDVQGGVFANGTPVQIYDCNGTQAQKWVISRGQNQIKVYGTNTYCLDAGSNPANGVTMKIWQCYDNLPAQQWYYRSDNHIELYGTGLCLDLTDGNLSNGNRIQTWQCANGNPNQIWNSY